MLLATPVLCGVFATTAINAQAPRDGTAGVFTMRAIALPGGQATGISMDYLAFDPKTGYVWVPAGNTGAVDVIDTATGKVTQIPGFATSETQTDDGKRILGPSSATVGNGRVYVGSRADRSVCAVDARTLERGACGRLDAMPDGLAYVAATNEVWVTTPRDRSIRILDAATLAEKAKLSFDGEPEGFAVDAKRGRFYTNLEDKDLTLAIDLTTRKTIATWKPACGEDGPHGLALDQKAGFLFVACGGRVEVLDVAHDGKVLSSIDTGDGVDAIDYVPSTHRVYAAAGGAAQLVIATVDGSGRLTVVAKVPTREGARNGVVGRDGTIYLGHSRAAALSEVVVVAPRSK